MPNLNRGPAAETRALRMVRITAQASSLLFSTSLITRARSAPPNRSWRALYLMFVSMHAVHFAAVTRYAAVTRGRALFPGGRDLRDSGGWPTVLGIYTLFFALAHRGWTADGSTGRRGARAGHVATGLLGAMFASAHLGQVPRSRWHAVPAAVVVGAVVADIVGGAESWRGHRSRRRLAGLATVRLGRGEGDQPRPATGSVRPVPAGTPPGRWH